MGTRASQGDVLSRTVRSPVRGTRSRQRGRWRPGLKPARRACHASHGIVGSGDRLGHAGHIDRFLLCYKSMKNKKEVEWKKGHPKKINLLSRVAFYVFVFITIVVEGRRRPVICTNKWYQSLG
jgi:hypothetical protein